MACLLQDRGGVLHLRTEPMSPRSRSSLTRPLGRRGSLWTCGHVWSPARQHLEAGIAGETVHTPHVNHAPLTA